MEVVVEVEEKSVVAKPVDSEVLQGRLKEQWVETVVDTVQVVTPGSEIPATSMVNSLEQKNMEEDGKMNSTVNR